MSRSRCSIMVAAMLWLIVAGSAVAAATAVPASRSGRFSTAIAANTLKPVDCVGISLTSVVQGVTGTSAADLQLGTSAAQSLNAAGGNDCVLGGGGNDTINGGAGTDVCIGGPGTDTFSKCETTIQ